VSALGLGDDNFFRDGASRGANKVEQPEVEWARKALLHPSREINPGSTNLLGKFIILFGALDLKPQDSTDNVITWLPKSQTSLPTFQIIIRQCAGHCRELSQRRSGLSSPVDSTGTTVIEDVL
jgi:hypothetical protein